MSHSPGRLTVLVVTSLLWTSRVAAQSCVAGPTGIVSWWPGDGDTVDYVDGNNAEFKVQPPPGFAAGAAALGEGDAYEPGLVGSAFSLGGRTFLDAGNAPSLQVSSGNFTIDTWVLFHATSCGPWACEMSLIDKMAAGGSNLDGWRLFKHAFNEVWFCLGGDCGNPAYTLRSRIAVQPGVWYHFAVVKTSISFSLYVNGRLDDRRSPVPQFIDTNSTPLLLGGKAEDYVGTAWFLEGLLDEVEIYRRALSSCEVARIYDAGAAGLCKGDADGDGVRDRADTCPAVVDPLQEDADGDGVGNACDCLPADPTAATVPPEVQGLAFPSGKDMVAWCGADSPAGSGTTYDVVRGNLDDVSFFGTGTDDVCLGMGVDATELPDLPFPPSAGHGHFYLARGSNACGTGRYETASDGRDRHTAACP